MTDAEKPSEGELILYQTQEGTVRIEMLYESETFWLNQKKIAELFGVDLRTISYHLGEIYASGELSQAATLQKIRRVQQEGNREVSREIEFYSLDAIISVGYRVNSTQATQFRIWATQTLREFVIKGFVLDDERLKLNKRFGKDYFDELLERIREIRASERRFYLKITDIYEQCSVDYDKNAEISKTFFKTVQNKLHWAVIREGVLKNIEITAEHFRALYNNLPFEHFVYDAKKVNRLRQFAVSNTVQILVINIDAFRKNFTGTEEEQKSNVIYKESDKLSGRQPIEFVQATRPIVIIDEPQSVDSTEKAQEAIRALNPLCTLRYSATHRNPYNLVYRLDPVRAFELRLVKQIVVAEAVAYGGANEAFVRVQQIDYKKGIKAKLRIHEQRPDGPKEKLVTVKNGTDLFSVSNERACYQDGFVVAEINAEPGNEFLRFNNGRVMRLGEESGGMRDDVWRAQIKHTVKKHLEKELQLRGRDVKVLSLFFIDRVANYRDYDGSGQPVKGKFAQTFEETLAEFAKDSRYAPLEWLKLPMDRLHNGYFAQDKKGVLKDTRGDTQADDEVYSLIMKEKERLLSEEEPLRFIFSHSALREGWDNPNVFQICTLNEIFLSGGEQAVHRPCHLSARLTTRRNLRRAFPKIHSTWHSGIWTAGATAAEIISRPRQDGFGSHFLARPRSILLTSWPMTTPDLGCSVYRHEVNRSRSPFCPGLRSWRRARRFSAEGTALRQPGWSDGRETTVA